MWLAYPVSLSSAEGTVPRQFKWDRCVRRGHQKIPGPGPMGHHQTEPAREHSEALLAWGIGTAVEGKGGGKAGFQSHTSAACLAAKEIAE